MTERIQYPPVYLGIYFLLMISVAAGIRAVTPPLPATFFTLLCGAIYGAGLFIRYRHGDENEVNFGKAVNGSAVLALVFCIAGVLISGVEMGLIILLITVQAGRNLVLTTRRDLNFACLISLMLLLFAAGKAMDSTFVIFMVLYALAGMFTLMSDHINARLGHAHGGDRDLLTRRMNLPVKGIGLALLTLSLAFAIYLLTPRPPSPRLHSFPASSNWNYDNRQWEQEARKPRQDGQDNSGRQDGQGNRADDRSGSFDSGRRRQLTIEAGGSRGIAPEDYTGFQDRFDLAEAGRCDSRQCSVVLYLQADNPLYVRGKVFEYFDGRSWENSGFDVRKRHNPEGRFTLGAQPRAGDTLQVFNVRQDLPPFVFAAYQPLQVSFPGNVIETDAPLTIRIPVRLRKGTVYSVVSHLEEVDGHPCSGASVSGDEGRTTDRRYLSLYPGVSGRLRELAVAVTREAQDDLHRAQAVEEYLRNNFAYTLDTVNIQWSGNPVEQFLFDLKAGHCELFASSMVIMLRSLDIPSRLATGFHVNRYNPVTGYFEVRDTDGHAWVEAFLEPHGWVTFEPTSSFRLPERPPRFFVATALIRYLEDRTEDLIRKNRDSLWVKFLMLIWPILMKLKLILSAAIVFIKLTGILLWYWFLRGGWLMILLFVATAGAGWRFWRYYEPSWRLSRLRRARSGDPHTFLRLCYREMERFFAQRGAVRAPQITAEEYKQVLTGRFSPLSLQITVITRLFEHAVYGTEQLDAFQLDAVFRAIEEIVRSGIPVAGGEFVLNRIGKRMVS